MPVTSRLKLGLTSIFLFATIACNAGQEDQLAIQRAFEFENSVVETVEAFVEFQSATQTAFQLSASPTASHTPTLTATASPSPTPEGAIAIVQEDTGCWAGPGDTYSIVKILEKGWVLTVDRLSVDGNYFVLLLPLNGGICWLGNEYANF